MSRDTVKEYFRAIYSRYRKATKELKHAILDEFCLNTGYNRKYAIRKLNSPLPAGGQRKYKRKRKPVYGSQVVSIIATVWEAAGYPCSVRLKALLVLWMPWIRNRFHINQHIERQILSISARQIDRRLKSRKVDLGKRIYGRTKPGTLLKHHIPIRTDNWDVKTPGWTEVDTVSHSGNSAEGTFGYTVNQTDILTTWVESRAVLGKAEESVVHALEDMSKAFPFKVKGMDSDNGSEFINWHVYRYCKKNKIQPFRGRPYKKDDNAHIEQKNWTHVRKLMGWDRYDTQEAVAAMNDLYKNELSLFMNLFMPSMKLITKKRIGSKLKRVYEKPKTPFERVLESKQADPKRVKSLTTLKDKLDPFALAKAIDEKLNRIYKLANVRQSPKQSQPESKAEKETITALSKIFPALSTHLSHPKKKEH